MNSSIFQHMAQLVRVRDLQHPLGPALGAQLAANDASVRLVEAAADDGYDPMSRISLVSSEENTVGWVGLDMLDGKGTVGECADPVRTGSVLAADTTALEAVSLFADTPWHFFFVLEHNLITGTLHYEDLFYGLPFSLCLFALMLRLEDSALTLLQKAPGRSWHALSESRRQQAESVFEKRYGHCPDQGQPPFRQLLACTMFCDKGTILRKLELLPHISGKKIREVFGRAERIRNDCAHTGSDEMHGPAPLGRGELSGFVSDVHALIDAIDSVE